MNKATIEQIWFNLIKELKSSFSNQSIYDHCIKPSKIIKISDTSINVLVPSIFAKSIFCNDYYEQIQSYFIDKLNIKFDFIFLINEEKSINNLNQNLVNHKLINQKNTGLNSEYTLDNYVVGEFNKIAYNAILTVYRNSGKMYNPLFIYAPTGLGKTHLINALGNMYLKHFPNTRIKYIDSNDFAREVFIAISKGSSFVEELKNDYISYDLLLIDDVQYLANKEKTNEIFFNIFNSLIKEKKQIVITSDKEPESLDSLDERMISRFNSGLTIKISNPDQEITKKIITEWLKEHQSNYNFQDEAINEIAKHYHKDFRKLIGFLNQIEFYAIQNLAPNDLITKDYVLKFFNQTQTRTLFDNDYNPEVVIATICKWYGVKEELVKGKSRHKQLTNVRHVCMYILRSKYNMPLNDIGSYFSNRDHTTVINAIEKIEKLIKKDNDLKDFIDKCLDKI